MHSWRAWLTRRHAWWVEVALVVTVWIVYEATRGLVVGSAAAAVRHARDVARFEQSLQVFAERGVQHAAAAVPGLLGVLGAAYLALHLTVTAGFLLWVHRRRPHAFAYFRNTLLLATMLAVVGYVVYPTAPPRLAGIGIADTVSNGHVDLNSGLVHSLYNPFAAIPSMHFGYALIIGVGLVVLARPVVVRIAGALYPVFVLFVIVATGNHFLVDAVAGALVAAVAAAAVARLGRRRHPPSDGGLRSAKVAPAPSAATSAVRPTANWCPSRRAASPAETPTRSGRSGRAPAARPRSSRTSRRNGRAAPGRANPRR